MPTNLFACPDIAVNTVSQDIPNQLKSIMSQASALEIDAHVAEQRVAELSAEFARLALGVVLSEMCRQHAALDMKSQGLSANQVSLRNEPGYWYWRSLKTTFGVVVVFTFAYRFKAVSGSRVTRNPAIEKVLPLRKMCSSSRRTLEWSTRLASLHPFRGAHHAYEDVAKHANAVFGQGSAAAKKFYRTALTKLTGKRPINRRNQPKLRTKTKSKGGLKRTKKRGSCRWRGVVVKSKEKARPAELAKPLGSSKVERKRQRNMGAATKLVEKGCGVDAFIDFVASHNVSSEHVELHEKYVSRLDANAWRMNYLALRQRGIQIGSGAMESIHRNGSQQRLELPGARWTERTAQALLHLRMMRIAGRWDDFWQQEGIDQVLLEAFSTAKEVGCVAA